MWYTHKINPSLEEDLTKITKLGLGIRYNFEYQALVEFIHFDLLNSFSFAIRERRLQTSSFW